MSVVNHLDVSIIENEITNISEIITILQQSEMNEDMIEHIRTLNNRISSMDLKNKTELIEVLTSKIMEYEAKQQENINNQEALNVLKSINPDFQRLSIISTKKEDNDSNRYIDYLTFTNDNDEIEMLSCDKETTVNEFIKANIDKLPSMSAKDVFHYFKEYVHRSVEFQSPEDLKNDLSTKEKAIVNDPEIEMHELEDVKTYKETYGIIEEIEVAIDNNGERIYRIKDGIIKFKTIENKRIMQILKQPTLKQNTYYSDMLSELDNDTILKPTEITNAEQTTNIRTNSYASLETITDDEFNTNRMDEIVAKRDVYDLELTYEEEHTLNVYIKHLLEHMKINIQANNPADEKTKLAVTFMESARGDKNSIVDTYQAIQDGLEKEDKLNNLEKEFATIYINNRERMKSLGLDNNLEKKRILEDHNIGQAGITSVVVLLELITLAMFIMMFLRLDI